MDDCGVVAFCMLNALREMHKRGIVHGDIKLSKVLIHGNTNLIITFISNITNICC